MAVLVMLHWVEGQFDLTQDTSVRVVSVNHRLYEIRKFEHHLRQDIDFLEYFAGAANTTRFMRCAELRSAKFDLLYFEPEKQGKRKRSRTTRKTETNFMDLLTPSGFLFLAVQLDLCLRQTFDLSCNYTHGVPSPNSCDA